MLRWVHQLTINFAFLQLNAEHVANSDFRAIVPFVHHFYVSTKKASISTFIVQSVFGGAVIL